MSQVRGHKRREARSRKRRHHRRSVFFISLSVICFIIALTSLKASLKKQEADYLKQEKQLQAQIDNEKARVQELDELEAYMSSDRYVEDTARKRFGMAYPNDLLLKAR